MNEPIPIGLCQCGCGQPTRIATQNSPRYGHVKGQPVRFIKNHDKRVRPVAAESRAKMSAAQRARWGERAPCKLDDCDDPARALGLCDMHYQRFKKSGSIDLPAVRANGRPARVTDLRRGVKLCTRCKEWKPLADFRNVPGRGGGGWSALCDPCSSAYQRERMRNLSDEQRDRYLASQKRWRDANRDQLSRKERKRRATKKGITPEQWAQMVEAQHGACAICGHGPEDPLELHIDHDHESGAVRGLLCGRCNAALGMLRDSQELMACAIEYLRLAERGVLPSVPLVRLRLDESGTG